MPAGRPKLGQELTLDFAVEFFERMYELILQEGEDKLYQIKGALIELSKQDKKLYNKNYPVNAIKKFKAGNKEENEAAAWMQEVYDFCKGVISYRLADGAIRSDAGLYAPMVKFVLINNHPEEFQSEHSNTTSVKVEGTGKVEIKSEGEEPEVS